MNPVDSRLSDGSTVSWPSDWRTVPLWSMFQRVKDLDHPNEDLLSVYREHGVVKRDSRDDNFNKTAQDRRIYQLVHPGWLVVNRMKAWQGSVGVSPFRGIVSGHYICFRSSHNQNHRFLNWLLRSDPYIAEYYSLSRGVRPSQVEIDNELLRSLQVKLPPMEEQRRIADFLDAETSHIDRIADTRRRQTSLLALREKSLIERLTREVVAPRVSIKRVAERITSGPRGWGDLVSDAGVLFLRITNIPRRGVSLLLDDVVYVDAPVGRERERTRTRVGDVLVSITADIGSVAVVDGSTVDANVSQHIALVRPNRGVCDPEWLAYSLKSQSVNEYLTTSSYGGTKVGLGLGEVGDSVIPLPDLSVQRERAARIRLALQNQRSLEVALSRQLDLLAGRRQALITAAVTGQLDVTTARSGVRV